MTAAQRARELEERLIDFTVRIIRVAEYISRSFTGLHFAKQLVRSGSAPALLYGEARSSESDKDFKHKMSIALKELRETHVNLRIIDRAELFGDAEVDLTQLIDENNQLISIFVASVRTTSAKIKQRQSSDDGGNSGS